MEELTPANSGLTPPPKKQTNTSSIFESKRDICTFTFIEVLQQPKGQSNPYLSIDEQVNKMWDSHTIEYYLTFKRKELITHVATQNES